MKSPEESVARIAIVMSGWPLFSDDTGSGSGLSTLPHLARKRIPSYPTSESGVPQRMKLPCRWSRSPRAARRDRLAQVARLADLAEKLARLTGGRVGRRACR